MILRNVYKVKKFLNYIMPDFFSLCDVKYHKHETPLNGAFEI